MSARMILDPDHPEYSDDALGEDDVERCPHGVPYDEQCEPCDLEDELDDDADYDIADDDEDLDDEDDDDWHDEEDD